MFAASKKSGLFKCSSRLGLAVSILAVCTVALTVDFSGASASIERVPSNLVNLPVTKLKRCRTLKVTADCTGSIL